MIEIVGKIKEGRAVKAFKCSDGKTYDKSVIVKMIKAKQISNATAQLWKGEYIVRVNEKQQSVDVKLKTNREEESKTELVRKAAVSSKVRSLTTEERRVISGYKGFNGYKILDNSSVAVYYMDRAKGYQDTLVDLIDGARKKKVTLSSSLISKEQEIVTGVLVRLGENNTMVADVKAYNLNTGNCKSNIVRLGIVQNPANKVEFAYMRGQHKIVVVGERINSNVSKVGIVIFDGKGNVAFVLDMKNKKAPELIDLNELEAECEVLDVTDRDVKVKINNRKYRFDRHR